MKTEPNIITAKAKITKAIVSESLIPSPKTVN
jgi:hypothetical protein